MDCKILSICIPTYNRAAILDGALEAIEKALRQIDSSEIELVISDNCSPDNTKEVVQKYKEKGLPISTYIRNEENLGIIGNIKQCFKLAKGKYVWVLGDDDYIRQDTLKIILDKIQNKDYGLVHIHLKYVLANANFHTPYIEFEQVEEFFKCISIGFTFITANIVATKYIADFDFEKYEETWIPHMPLYMMTAKKYDNNLIINQELVEAAKDYKTNGGYNFFKVFIDYYLTVRKEMLQGTKDAEKYYRIEKKFYLKHFVSLAIFLFYIRRIKAPFEKKGAWEIIKKHYGKEPYFYPLLILYVPKITIQKIFGKIKRMITRK
ncbi:MAG: glycosyltransferase family 2 protein [Capnocytophaga leadbetteri]|jgi:glycosyltransferase, family 2